MSMPARPARIAAALALALACAAAPARADDRHARRVPMLETYRQECSSCHTAYAPMLLPAASWRHLMANLSSHFGTDASFDAAAAAVIASWLESHAAGGRRGRDTPPEHRITRAAWFVREHREVAPAQWRQPAVRSASNCGACHRGADDGRFDEDDLRIPR